MYKLNKHLNDFYTETISDMFDEQKKSRKIYNKYI